jgi:hypothetical protein
VVVDEVDLVVLQVLFPVHSRMAEAVLMVPQVVVAVQMDLVVEVVLMEIVMVLMEEMLVHYLLGLVLLAVVPVKILKAKTAALDFSYQPHIMTHLL